MKSNTIVVCGAGGFIGGHLVSWLRANGVASIRAVDIKPVGEWYQRVPGVENLTMDARWSPVLGVGNSANNILKAVNANVTIEGGRVTAPCRGATLIGNCLDALGAIDAVGNDFWMKTGICGKGGQSVPVGTGQGHVRIASMTVGGTQV